MSTNKIVTAFVAVLVGVILIPVINDTVTDANITGSLGVILSLIPLLFALGIVVLSFRSMS